MRVPHLSANDFVSIADVRLATLKENRGLLMGNRHEQRIAVSLPVRVSGTDREGNPFTQSARVVEVSRGGARLEDIRCLHQPGDFIEIEHNNATARFRVEWIGAPGTSQDGQAGISALQLDKNIWRKVLAPPSRDTYEPPPSVASGPWSAAAAPAWERKAWDGAERRGSTRIKASGTVRVQVEGASFPIWAELADISLGGCYVKMLIPTSVGSPVSLTFNINQQSITTKGRVVVADQGVGAGIRFELDPTEMVDLWRLLRKMGSEIIRDRSKQVQDQG
jgi:hypothetical protein